MTVKLYKTKNDQINGTPTIIENVIKIVDQTSDNEIDIFKKSSHDMAEWKYIENRDSYYLITITE